MTASPTFRWTLSYGGCAEYEVRDATGVYEVEIREFVCDHQLKIANGDERRAEIRASLGILRRRHSMPVRGSDARTFAVPPATIVAFNAWRLARHEALMRDYPTLRSDDPLRNPPRVAVGGEYVVGTGWVSAETQEAA